MVVRLSKSCTVLLFVGVRKIMSFDYREGFNRIDNFLFLICVFLLLRFDKQ